MFDYRLYKSMPLTSLLDVYPSPVPPSCLEDLDTRHTTPVYVYFIDSRIFTSYTDHSEVHDFDDPDCESKVDDDDQHHPQNHCIQTSLPPPIDTNLIDDVCGRGLVPHPAVCTLHFVTHPTATHQQLKYTE